MQCHVKVTKGLLGELGKRIGTTQIIFNFLILSLFLTHIFVLFSCTLRIHLLHWGPICRIVHSLALKGVLDVGI